MEYNVYLVKYPARDFEHPLRNTEVCAIVSAKSKRNIKNIVEDKLPVGRDGSFEIIITGRGKIKDTGFEANKEKISIYLRQWYEKSIPDKNQTKNFKNPSQL